MNKKGPLGPFFISEVDALLARPDLWPTSHLPAESFLEEGNGQFALCLQRSLIESVQQLEQRTHAARTTGEDEASHIIRQVQATARRPQLERAQLVLIGELLQLEHQRQAQPRLEIRQLHGELAGRGRG